MHSNSPRHKAIMIRFIPGGFCLGGKIAPIFFNTMEDAGALPIECDVSKMKMGDVIDIFPYKGIIKNNNTAEILCDFSLKTDIILDEVQAGGRIPLIIGRGLTSRAREALGLQPSDLFRKPNPVNDTGKGYTLAQKIVGKACEVDGIRPETYCDPKMTTVGSQDTTGPMTRDELKDLACLGFSSDLVMQSFCHTAAYPKPIDINTHHTLKIDKITPIPIKNTAMIYISLRFIEFIIIDFINNKNYLINQDILEIQLTL